jgi:CPA1 family monovalent cation:H+ antiporter
MVLFAFNGLVFVLLGVQLYSIIGALSRSSPLELAGYALALSAIVIVLRILWVFPAAYLPLLLSRRIREREGVHSPRAVFLTGWAGIRGSITLAAALSIPLVTSTGEPFPGRELIILLAASVIIVTLLVNGMTLPLLIRWLDIRGDRIAEREERAARIATAQAAIESLRKRLPRLTTSEETAFANSLRGQYEQRLQRYSANAERRSRLDAQHASERRIWLAATPPSATS